MHIKIISYNIWFDNENKQKRLSSLYNVIDDNDPDVICLQEVTEVVFKLLISKLNNYYYYPKILTSSYGCVTFSKNPIQKTKIIILPSNMNRSLILTQIDNFIIANMHFESEFESDNINKILQYQYISSLLTKLHNNYDGIILCSDTNLTTYDEQQYNECFDGMNDAWNMDKNENNKYTYDFVTNKNARLKIRSRIDRILYCGNNITLKQFNLLKCEMYKIQPSDHHGLLAVFN